MDLKILTGNANPKLAEDIAEHALREISRFFGNNDRFSNVKLVERTLSRFSDGEIQFNILESVRGGDTFVIQSTSSGEQLSVNDSIMELLIMIDGLRRASAENVNIVIPYFGYARQDRKVGTRTPISAALIASVIQFAGAKRVLTLDLHSDQTQGFFSIPVDNLNATKTIAQYFLQKNLNDAVVVSPDAGGTKRARKMAKLLNDAPLVVIDKRRPAPNVSEIMHILGEVKNKSAIIVDDMIDTGGTVINAANALLKEGAKEVYVCATHPVLSGDAAQKFQYSGVKELVVCDTIQIPESKRIEKLKIISVAPLLAEAIARIHTNTPLTDLIED